VREGVLDGVAVLEAVILDVTVGDFVPVRLAVRVLVAVLVTVAVLEGV
jgi:hypothetical protein